MPPAEMSPQIDTDALLVLGLVFFSVIIINMFPLLTLPFEFLYTAIHEMGHATATSLTGGEVVGIKVYRRPTGRAKGVADRKGGNAFVVNPAGYLGVSIFSASLILLSSLPHLAPYTLGALGVFLIIMTLAFGRSLFTWFVGLGFGAGFIWVAWQAHLIWVIFLLNLVAIQIGLAALVQFKILGRAVRLDPSGKDDASQMAKQFRWWPFRKPMFWVRTWAILSVLVIGAAFVYTWIWNVFFA